MLILQIVVLQKVLKSYLYSYTLSEFHTFNKFDYTDNHPFLEYVM